MRGDQDDLFCCCFFFQERSAGLLSSAAHSAASGDAVDETRCEDDGTRPASSCESQMSLRGLRCYGTPHYAALRFEPSQQNANALHTHTHTHIYACVYVCVCINTVMRCNPGFELYSEGSRGSRRRTDQQRSGWISSLFLP